MNDSVFLGTGAAELYPNPFCGCAVCRRARENRETRLRASFLFDETMMADFGPDVCAASQHYGVPLDRVEHVLVTHTHEDHLNASTFSVLTMTDMTHPIHFYLSPEGYAYLENVMEAERAIPGTFGHILTTLLNTKKIALHAVQPYETFSIGNRRITPLKTNHRGNGAGETAVIYRIEWERGRWLYATDTGNLGAETMRYLADDARAHGALDTIIIEGTHGSVRLPDDAGHMDAYRLVRQLSALRREAILDDHTRVFVTHINQVQHFSHAEYSRYMALHADAHVSIAYDGMRI